LVNKYLKCGVWRFAVQYGHYSGLVAVRRQRVKMAKFGFQLEIVVVKLWPFASNKYVKSTGSSFCDLNFL
jgi:hypothetical protein